MSEPRRASATAVAAALSLAAAFVWSTYYFFLLDLQGRGVAAAPNTAVPFLAGGLAYLGLAWARGQRADLARLLRSPSAYVRVGLLVGMQLLVLAGTFVIGPVDTALLTLVGDTVLTPVIVLTIFREGRDRLGSATFFAGVACCVFGAALAIVAGSSASAIGGLAWVLVVAMPVVIAVYFLWVARLARREPIDSLVAHATLFAAVVSFALAGLLPGGFASLASLDPVEIVLLVVNGVLSFFVGPWLYFRAIRSVGMILPAVLMATIPVFTLVLGIVLDRSLPPWLGLIGIPLAVVGAFLAMRGETEPPAPAVPRAADLGGPTAQ